jgi:hypothetical protein
MPASKTFNHKGASRGILIQVLMKFFTPENILSALSPRNPTLLLRLLTFICWSYLPFIFGCKNTPFLVYFSNIHEQ